MVIIRLLGLLFLIAMSASLVLFLFTRNRRYLTFTWQLFKFAVVLALVFAALYLLERLIVFI